MNQFLTIIFSFLSIYAYAPNAISKECTSSLSVSVQGDGLTGAENDTFFEETKSWVKNFGYEISNEDTQNSIVVSYQKSTAANSSSCSNIEVEKKCTISIQTNLFGKVISDEKSYSVCKRKNLSAVESDFSVCDKALNQFTLSQCPSAATFPPPVLNDNYSIYSRKDFVRPDNEGPTTSFSVQAARVPKMFHPNDPLSVDRIEYEIRTKEGKLETKTIDLSAVDMSPIFDGDIAKDFSSWKFTQFIPLNEEQTLFLISMRLADSFKYAGPLHNIPGYGTTEHYSSLMGKDPTKHGDYAFFLKIENGKATVHPRPRYGPEEYSYKTGKGSTRYAYTPWSSKYKSWLKLSRTGFDESGHYDDFSLQFIKYDLNNNNYYIDRKIDLVHPLIYFNYFDTYQYQPEEYAEILSVFNYKSEWIGYRWTNSYPSFFTGPTRYFFINMNTDVRFFLDELEGYDPSVVLRVEDNLHDNFIIVQDELIFYQEYKLKTFSMTDLANQGKAAKSNRTVDLTNIVDRQKYNFKLLEALDENTFIFIKVEIPPTSYGSNIKPRKKTLVLLQIGEDQEIRLKEIFLLNKLKPGWFIAYLGGAEFKEGKFKFKIDAASSIFPGAKSEVIEKEIELK